MPKDLPGFYFDHAKNRYFPLSSAPPSRPPPPPPPPRPAPPPPLSLWHSLQQSKSVLSTTQRLSHHHRIIQAQVASTAKCHTTPFPLPVKTTISALSIDWYNDRLSGLAGDVNGILYSMEEPIEGYSDFQAPPTWAQQPSMGSPVSSMSTSGPIRVVTSFGQRSRICVHNLANGVISYLPGQRHMDDIRTSHLRNRGLALGTRRRACHIPDIGHMRGLQCYETGSDVFAVFQEENTLYTGTRNGSVARHDFRKAGSELLLDNVFAKSSNSISYLHVVNDWQLLVSTIRGNIELFDIRYDHGARAVMTIHGQINSYMPHLPHALSPSQDYLFAAGIDNRIRAWSLRTGNALSSQVERVEHEKCINPFTYRFPDTAHYINSYWVGKYSVMIQDLPELRRSGDFFVHAKRFYGSPLLYFQSHLKGLRIDQEKLHFKIFNPLHCPNNVNAETANLTRSVPSPTTLNAMTLEHSPGLV